MDNEVTFFHYNSAPEECHLYRKAFKFWENLGSTLVQVNTTNLTYDGWVLIKLPKFYPSNMFSPQTVSCVFWAMIWKNFLKEGYPGILDTHYHWAQENCNFGGENGAICEKNIDG